MTVDMNKMFSNIDTDKLEKLIAMRTAFVSRFIVLRAQRRSRANRRLVQLTWTTTETAESLKEQFREILITHGEYKRKADRDLDNAYSFAVRSSELFCVSYFQRATTSFKDALYDFFRSNAMLFGEDSHKKCYTGWNYEDYFDK